MVRVSISFANGQVSIMTLTRIAPTDRSAEAMQYVEAEIRRAALPTDRGPITGWRFIDRSELPTREYRNAWTDNGSQVTHDLNRAKELCRENVRFRRAKLFADLTVEQERAGRDEAKLAAIEANRQRLRDAPADPRIAACATIQELIGLDPLRGIQ